jgi:hypothetical protein
VVSGEDPLSVSGLRRGGVSVVENPGRAADGPDLGRVGVDEGAGALHGLDLGFAADEPAAPEEDGAVFGGFIPLTVERRIERTVSETVSNRAGSVISSAVSVWPSGQVVRLAVLGGRSELDRGGGALLASRRAARASDHRRKGVGVN